MCQSFMEFADVAQECGWFGWQQGPSELMVYRCGCFGEHLEIYVADQADDPDYYVIQCAKTRECVNN